MKNIIKITLALLIIGLCGGSAKLSAGLSHNGQSELTTEGTDTTVYTVNLDSIHAVYVDSIVNVAKESYTRSITLESEGEDYSEVMPVVYQAYLDNVVALKESEPQSEDWYLCRNMLISLNPKLEAGAFYYSSKGNTDNLAEFAQAYIDTQLMPEMSDIKFDRDPNSFPTIAYIASSRAYNQRDLDKAIEYFKVYFSTGASEHRENVFVFMGQACINTGNYDLAVTTLQEGSKQYPLNPKMAMLGVKACVDGGHGEALQPFLDKALAMSPNDEQLLNLQGMLLEDACKYAEAIEVYNKINELSPNKLSVAKHIGLCYFNLGVTHFNEAVYNQDEKTSRKNRRLAKNYFVIAIQKLEEVKASDPMAVPYLKALGVAYLCVEDKSHFDEINRQLAALGQDVLTDAFMPQMMTYNDNKESNLRYVVGANALNTSVNIPKFSEYSSQYIVDSLSKWAAKGEFEKDDAYLARVNDQTILRQIDNFSLQAQKDYLDMYGNRLVISELQLHPYDATNETFMISTSYGDITVNVPLKDNEAERFKSNWRIMKFREPKYYIDNDQVMIASLSIEDPEGHVYRYDRSMSAAYSNNQVNIDYDAIVAQLKSGQQSNTNTTQRATAQQGITLLSDVDKDIPQTSKTAPNTFALIICNENYANVPNVKSAIHDGEVIAEYLNKTIGLPAQNIWLVKDATLGRMLGEINQFQKTVNAFGGNAEAIVYYAGHGIPDENTKDAYLMPVDGLPTMLNTSYPLQTLYTELSNMSAKSISVFMDACFSGIQRDGSTFTSTRGVGIVHKEAKPKGNMFILTAASAQETAMHYAEKNHGLFTYYLLKKLRDSKGNATLKEISDYVIENVKQQSNVINRKQQTPSVSLSGDMYQLWNTKKLIP